MKRDRNGTLFAKIKPKLSQIIAFFRDFSNFFRFESHHPDIKSPIKLGWTFLFVIFLTCALQKKPLVGGFFSS